MNDEIIRDVRTNREDLVNQHGDLAGLFRHLKEREATHPERIQSKARAPRDEEVEDAGGLGT